MLASFFVNIGRADTLGSGMRNLYKYTKLYSNSEPILSEGDVFEMRIPLKKSDIETKKSDFEAQKSDVIKILGCSRSTASDLMKRLKDANLVVPIQGKGKGKYRLKYETEMKE